MTEREQAAAILRARLTLLLWGSALEAGGSVALGDGACAEGKTRVALAWPLTVGEDEARLADTDALAFLDLVAEIERRTLAEG